MGVPKPGEGNPFWFEENCMFFKRRQAEAPGTFNFVPHWGPTFSACSGGKEGYREEKKTIKA